MFVPRKLQICSRRPPRLLVIGCSGGGKTTYSAKIAACNLLANFSCSCLVRAGRASAQSPLPTLACHLA
jgi:adenylate kinase family enzyme